MHYFHLLLTPFPLENEMKEKWIPAPRPRPLRLSAAQTCIAFAWRSLFKTKTFQISDKANEF